VAYQLLSNLKNRALRMQNAKSKKPFAGISI
jgi:hypothetical protein